ncbi:S8 family peptidase [Bacillus thuringiensis]|uniref:Subtilisin like serine protease n=1 Tax=Bacillus thuringiensis YBT-1518 TaxID=529122 RepID=A0A9W3PIU5_BACTU|nr:S8 family peptidase [Bacillus thuringiensis]AHA74910.1 subtilisin like serine protease [Bacillus thuringiensis YBT-1518]EKS8365385.1 S8 family serine peptidase [Bacillus cereus]
MITIKKLIAITLSLGLSIFSFGSSLHVQAATKSSVKDSIMQSLERNTNFKQNEVLVKFKDFNNLENLKQLQNHFSFEVQNTFPLTQIQLIKFHTDINMKELIQTLNKSPNIEYAEPNYIVSPAASSNDSYYNSLWGLKNIGQNIQGSVGSPNIDINVEEAWTKTEGSSNITIGIIDTGIDINHPDLKNNIWKNPDEIPGDGIDNDNNGYIDDIYGWDFVNNNNSVYDGTGDSHGTHVAGTIAAVKNNTIGVAGVAPQVKVMSLKFLGTNGGTISNAIKAIEYAKNKGVKITNNSWGGGGFSQALYDAIQQSNSLFIAASGNNGTNADQTPMYPAAYSLSNILSVASITNKGSLSSFSNYGKTSVDVAAPGTDILSTLPNNSYGFYSGTSMATPHVSGVAALIQSAYPSYSPTEIKNKIMNNTSPLSTLTNKVLTGGLINAGKALQTYQPISYESEPNNDIASANSLPFNRPLNGSLNQNDAQDIFKIDVPSKMDLSISVQN